MIVALVALVAATAGNAIADGVNAVVSSVKANQVTSRHVKNGTLRLVDFRRADRTSLRGARGLQGPQGPQGPQGAQGAQGAQGPAGTPDGYTKTEADAKFIDTTEKAADADALDGTDSDDFVAGDSAISWTVVTRADDTAEVKAADLGDIGEYYVTCGAAGLMGDRVVNTTGTDLDYARTITANATATDSSGAAILANNDITPGGSTSAAHGMTLQLFRPSAFLLGSTDSVTLIVNATNGGTECRWHIQIIHGEGDGGLIFIPPR